MYMIQQREIEKSKYLGAFYFQILPTGVHGADNDVLEECFVLETTYV